MKRKAQQQKVENSKRPKKNTEIQDIDAALDQLNDSEQKQQKITKKHTDKKSTTQQTPQTVAKKVAVEVPVGVEWGGLAFSKPAKQQQQQQQQQPAKSESKQTQKPSTSKSASTPKETVDEREKKTKIASESDSDSDGSDDDAELSADDDKPTKKQRQTEKKHLAQFREDAIAQREKELLQADVLPETSQDYERLLLASPNSSFIWIKYMAYKLSLTDIEGARAIGERALKAIGFREEQEKFNVYATLLNIESKFGTQETLDAMFKRALQYCEPKPVWLQMAKIYEQNSDTTKVVETYEKGLKKFKKSRKLWENYELFYVKQGDFVKASQILQRSLLSLPQRKQVQAISKFAIMQYKHGKAENGRKIFEGILTNHPSRTDIWSMYIDLEMSVQEYEHVRQIYHRVVSLKLSTYKMKSFLQRFLNFETQHGTPEAQEQIKQIAVDYIARKTASQHN